MKKILMTFVVVFSILAVVLLSYMFTRITEDSKISSTNGNVSASTSNRGNNSNRKDNDNSNSNDNNMSTTLGDSIGNLVNDIFNNIDWNDADTNVNYISSGVLNVSGSKLVNTQTLSTTDINSISIEYKSFNITLYPSKTNELIIMEYMNYTPSENELAQISKSNNSLVIKSGHKENLGTTILPGNNKVDIYIPTEYSGNLVIATTSGNISSDLVLNLDNFVSASLSGNIIFNDITSKNIVLTTTSGNIEVNKAEGVRTFATTSGNIKIYNGNGNTNTSSTSGNVTIENASGTIDAVSTSGKIKVDGLSGGGNISTTSGIITLLLNDDLDSLLYDISLAASSGNINLSIPSNLSFNFKAKTNTGDIRTTFDNELTYNDQGNNATGTVGKDPSIGVDIVSTTGNIHVD